ncbi:3393_t:CDS:2 [Acaulospora morrowiae]|uniref:1-acyl-sn-glycerol-3-phosphate acyltransferase n=1 Tax=Acaulospora morrowiae TaxID=94023 RepID=A0A9N9G3X3_9GLOM|nr:3393_t:CDS:2 [Acaulospora morrowiae]
MTLDSLLTQLPLIAIVTIPALVIGSRLSTQIQFIVKANICLFFILFFSAFGTIVAIIFALIGKRGLINWVTARGYAYIAGGAVGISYRVDGEEHMNTERPAIYICNHQSAGDLFVLGRIFPKNCVVVSKSSLKFVPIMGMFMILGQAVFLDRKNHNGAVSALSKAAQDIKRLKISAFVFPEGTRARLEEADLLPFKKGAFHMAVQAGIPIIPIVVANYSDIYSSRQRIFRGGQIHIKVLPSIETTGIDVDDKDQINDLAKKAREIMLKTLKEITPDTNGAAKRSDL